MIDPGALGTLIIGLDRVRREEAYSEPSSPRRTNKNQHRSFSGAAARWLRNLADAIERQPRTRDLAVEG